MTSTRPGILLVDDIEANLFALEALLESMGCELVRATTGNEALRQMLKRDFALVLLDVQMPDMDGYEVARLLRENPVTRDVPIIFVTATLETPENALRGYGTGAVDCLFKPINAHILRSKVRVFVDLYLARARLLDEIVAHQATLVELARSNTALRRANEAAQLANRELESFSYSVAHDLRAPLRAIDGFSSVLASEHGAGMDDEARHYLDRIRTAARRMALLIDDLLALSRITRVSVQRQHIDLTALANATFSRLVERDPERKVDIKVADGLVAHADPRLVAVAIENLVGNAWKFTSKRPDACIELGAIRHDEEHVFFVRDNGAGFDMEHVAQLFAPFRRLHSDSEFEGTGVGLATVQRVVVRHEGRIWAEGATDRGASFFFTLGGAE